MTTGAAVKRQVGSDPEGKGLRHAEDFYRTGEVATRALLAVERFPGTIWEPACGDGAMSRVLETSGAKVLSSDLYDRGYGDSPRDFLATKSIANIDHIVTNPPYELLDEFVLKAVELNPPGKVAMIARLQWLEGQRRKKKIFDVCPPTRVWVFSCRVPMTRGDLAEEKTGLIAYAWFIWDMRIKGHPSPSLGWL